MTDAGSTPATSTIFYYFLNFKNYLCYRGDLIMAIKVRVIREAKNKDGKEQGVDGKACWKGYRYAGTEDGKDKCVPMEENYIYITEASLDDGTIIEDMEFWDDVLEEAEYQGRKVTLNKPTRGDVKKFKVYVKDPKTGNVKKVNFGDPNMRIRKSNPKARKSFRARHKCKTPGPKTKARYWSCKKW